MEELISIIVPVYNVEKYLHRCIESIRNQSYKNLEIILVDDGSSDQCPQMCDDFAVQDQRIKVIHRKNGGQGLARNSALDIATGAYIAFIDSDDWISPNHIKNLYNELKRCSADVAIGSYTAVGTDQSQKICRTSLEERIYEGEEITKRLILPLFGADEEFRSDVQVNASSSMSLYSMKLIAEYGIRFLDVREVVGEDLFFNLDFCFRAKKIVVVDEIGYYYFENQSSTSRKYDSNRFSRTLEFKKALEMRAAFWGLTKEAEMRIERSFLMKIRVIIRLIVTDNDLPRAEKIQSIRNILRDETVHRSLTSYPIESYIPAIRVLVILMREKKVVLVYFLMRFRESAKRNNVCVRILRIFGIGR